MEETEGSYNHPGMLIKPQGLVAVIEGGESVCTGEWADSQEIKRSCTGVQDLREHLWDQASGMNT